MYSPIAQTPFLLVLLPLIVGIVLQYFGSDIRWSIVAALLGSAIVLLSFGTKWAKQFSQRWLFTVGAVLLFVAVGGMATYTKQQSLDYTLSDSIQTYVGYVTDTPQEKPNSVAHKIYIPKEDINVVCYLQKDSLRTPLPVGTEIAFQVQLQTFRNAGNPNEFDYERYMYNQGFVASAYLSNYSWMETGETNTSLKIVALQVREQVMQFYESLGFEGDNLAVLSALTLGYQDTLSDDLIQGFRTTGIVHILSVSGLHVMIIFSIINFLLSFIAPTSRFYRWRFLIIIVLLWVYAFVTGLPASVVRASGMLSVFCLARLFSNRKYSGLNGLYIAAFFMLLYNPFWLFDVGFQLSFVSVLSILVLYNRMANLIVYRNKFVRYVWQMFCLTFVAQLATFPLCLYYFGTFPTYFFIGNLFIVPLVSLIMYGVGAISIAYLVALLLPSYVSEIYYLPVSWVDVWIEVMNGGVKLLEQLPFALVENIEMSFIQLVLVFSIIIAFLFTGIRNSSKALIGSLSLSLILVFTLLAKDIIQTEDQLIVYNRYGETDIAISYKNHSTSLDSLLMNTVNPLLEIGDKKVIIINQLLSDGLETRELYQVDVAILVSDQFHTLSAIEERYKVSIVVLDSSLQSIARKQLTKECENRNIPIYDVTKKGAFSIIF